MGYYIDPPNQSKESFLNQHGRRVNITDLKITDTELPVVLVNNFAFTAAGIAYDEKELKEFLDPDDYRPKMYFMVPREALKPYYDQEEYDQLSKEEF